MINEKTGQVIQLSTLNNQPVMTDSKTGRVLMGDAQPQLTAQNGWFRLDKTPGAAGAVQGAEESAKQTAKTTAEADTQITQAAQKARASIIDNNLIRDILNSSGQITNMLGSVSDPVSRAILTAAQEGLQVGSTSISLPVEETLSALKVTDPADRDRLQVLRSLLSKKVFGAVQSAGFKGSQSDKELDQIRQAVPTPKNSKEAIMAMLALDDYAAKKDQRIADQWNAYLGKAQADGITNVNYNQWARDNADIATNPKYGTNLLEEAKANVARSLRAGATAPSAPGSKPSNSGLPSDVEVTFDKNGKRIIKLKGQ
jgi:hypothetical protein